MLTSVKCRWREAAPDKERLIPVEECLACARTGLNPCGLPLPIIKFVTRDRKPETVQHSATMFGGCPREHGIKKNYDYAIDPARAYTRAYGSLVHLGAESALAREKVKTEERYYRPITLDDGRELTVSAQLDACYFLDKHTVAIHDYKVVDTVSDSAITRKVAHYIPQFSIQRWILAAHDITVERIDLHFLSQKVPRVVNLFPDGEPEVATAYIWSLDDTEKFLREKLPVLADSLEGNLPPPISEPSELWRCNYCDVREQCEKLYGKAIPASVRHKAG